MEFSISTKRMVLHACDKATYTAILTSNEVLSQHLDCQIPNTWSEFGLAPFQYGADLLEKRPNSYGWFTYLPVHQADNILIGSGGYKGPPQDGVVEIGYEIIAPYRQQGLATEMAQGLIQMAFGDEGVHTVMAHTLAEENASCQVLRKCGMAFVKQISDPEDGDIWEWKLRRQ